ncbi:MAG: TetR/AcrR family transcriptional regulator [Deltaproteobacteria bacterium]|nr:TetR/AcrR family transcriptional regulator [Deltaproteobacteria bacterium]
MSSETHEQRREAQRDSARRTILDATAKLLLEEGFDAFSIRRLVERCGYAAPSIYHYFGDKDGLLDALIDERFAKLMAQLRRVPRGDDPVANIRGLAIAFVKFGLKNPEHFRVLFTPRAGDQKPPTSSEEARKFLEETFRALWETGRLRTGEMQTAGQALSVLCQGLVWSRISRPDYAWGKTLNEDAIDALLRGLVSPDDAATCTAGEKP